MNNTHLLLILLVCEAFQQKETERNATYNKPKTHPTEITVDFAQKTEKVHLEHNLKRSCSSNTTEEQVWAKSTLKGA